MNLFHSASFALQNGELDNRGVDWVIHYNFDDLGMSTLGTYHPLVDG